MAKDKNNSSSVIQTITWTWWPQIHGVQIFWWLNLQCIKLMIKQINISLKFKTEDFMFELCFHFKNNLKNQDCMTTMHTYFENWNQNVVNMFTITYIISCNLNNVCWFIIICWIHFFVDIVGANLNVQRITYLAIDCMQTRGKPRN